MSGEEWRSPVGSGGDARPPSFLLTKRGRHSPAPWLGPCGSRRPWRIQRVRHHVVDPVFVQRMWITKSIGHNKTSLNPNVQVKIKKGSPKAAPFTFQYCLRLIALTMRAGAARMARARAAMCR